jgi:cell wall-associated NlpC family hydrolase
VLATASGHRRPWPGLSPAGEAEKERDTHVSRRRAAKPSLLRRTAALTASVLAAGTLATFAGAAGAAPQPTVSQVQKAVDQLTTQMDQAAQHYDQATQELASANQRLALVTHEVSADRLRFQTMRSQIAAIASTAYENNNMSSMGALLTSDNPQAVLSQASTLMQLSADRSAQVTQFLASASQLEGAQQMAHRTQAAVASLHKQLLTRKQSIAATLAKKKALLSTLTAQQTPTVGSGGTTSAVYTGTTSTQAGKAVAFAYAQLGKPYLWGGTGPDAYDCSGLVGAAWAAAGVAIPRDTYSQVAALPAVPLSDLQPGDLVFFDSDGHVAMYVGGGMIIDAPQQGENVERISLSSSWYAANVDSAARP